MAMIPTKQLFDEYFFSVGKEYVGRIRKQCDRPEVYEYEKKIGKQLVEMNVDELFEMINSFNEEGFSVSYSSYDVIAVYYRKIFDYYIEHYELIKNPWHDMRMRGMRAYERLVKDKNPITWEMVDNTIKEVYKTNELERAKYIECIVRLYYDGFEKSEEIVKLKESMIDFEKKQANLSGRLIQFDDKCFDLLNELHNMETMKGWRGDYYMASWHDSYFKFPIRPTERVNFDNRSLVEVGNLINRTIHERIRKGLGIDINYRMLYFLGFYDFLVKKCGRDEANRILTSVRVREDVNKLSALSKLYGITNIDVPRLKKYMRPYVNYE